MFEEKKFSEILQKIIDSYDSITEFSECSKVNRTYLSKYINMKLENPPAPRILSRIADKSKNLTTYDELMQICGYTKESLEEVCSSVFKKLNDICAHFTKHLDDMYEIPSAIETFNHYINDLSKNLKFPTSQPIRLTNYYSEDSLIEDNSFIIAFLFIYDSLISQLLKKSYIENLKYKVINWDNYDEIYEQFCTVSGLELLSYSNSYLKVIENHISRIIDYSQKFNMCLRFSYASTFDNNKLIELFNSKIDNSKAIQPKLDNITISDSKFHMCPVYGKISAGIPNWAEECLEGYLPIDPNLMGIINPDECFFLRVDGESMNKVVRNGAYALIRKQDIVENGEIAAVLVNGYEATLKKFSKQGDLVILEPMSDDPSFTTQVYNKETQIRIIGKYIGKFEMNK